MSNAFAPIVRARPNPIFGRPVHQGSPPIDYSPILLLKPFGFRIAPDTLSSDENLVGQRGITPAFGYSAPHPSAGGTLTLLIHVLPSAHYETFRRECVPIGHAVNPNIAMVTFFSCHADAEEARRRGTDGFRFFQFALAHHYVFGKHTPGRPHKIGR